MWLLFTVFAIAVMTYTLRALRDYGNPPVERLSPKTVVIRDAVVTRAAVVTRDAMQPSEQPVHASDWRNYYVHIE